MGPNFSGTVPEQPGPEQPGPEQPGPERQIFRRRETVIVTDLHDELVLLDPQSVEMYSLNAVGRAVWLALPATPEAAAAHVTATFAAEPAEALGDVLALLHDLQRSGLVESPGPHAR